MKSPSNATGWQKLWRRLVMKPYRLSARKYLDEIVRLGNETAMKSRGVANCRDIRRS